MNPFELLGSQVAAPQGARPDGERVLSPGVAARWLYELERAQWALRGVRESGASISDHTQTQKEAVLPAASVKQVEPGQAARSVGASRSANTMRGTGAPARSVETGEVAPPLSENSGEPSGMPEQASQRYNERSTARAIARLPDESIVRKREWSRVNAHAYSDGESADVWVRDAALDTHERPRLATELRTRLGAAGLRLGTLVVNGEVVLPVPPARGNPDEDPSA